MSRGIHTEPVNGLSNDWLTPPSVIASLGTFDLDPCCHPQQFYQTAKKAICLPTDGLAEPWHGRVWLNPPYGSALKHWLKKMAKHNHGTALVPARTEVESWFWPYIWDAGSAVLFLKGRLYFHLPDGSQKGNAGHGSVLVAYGDDDAKRLMTCGLAGRFFELATRNTSG